MHARLGTGEDERPRSRRRRGWRAVDLTGNRYCCRPIARQRTRAIAAHAKALPRRVCGPLPAPIYFQVISSPASLLYLAARSQSQATLLGWGKNRQFTPSHQPSICVDDMAISLSPGGRDQQPASLCFPRLRGLWREATIEQVILGSAGPKAGEEEGGVERNTKSPRC